MQRFLLFSTLLVLGTVVAGARVMDEDDSISFELPWEESCASCEVEWEPLFPPAGIPESGPNWPDVEFTAMGVVDEPGESADVPEPVTWVLIGTALTALGVWRKRRNSGPL